MIIKNSSRLSKNSNQAFDILHKESFKRENKSILDDSEFTKITITPLNHHNQEDCIKIQRMKFIMTQLRPRIFYL